MATLNVSLPKTMIDFVDAMVAEGRYASSSDVVGEALQLFRREEATRRETAVLLQSELAAGLADAAAGRFSQRSVSEIADSVLGEAARR